MKKIILLICVVFTTAATFAQTSIVIQNGNKFYVSNRLDSIKVNTAAGDTIYLPGGIVNMYGNWIIDKELHIYGAGFYPDSSTATGLTYIPGGNFYFIKGSNNSSVEGVHLLYHIYIGQYGVAGNDSVSNLLIKRCNFNSISMGYYSNNNSLATNITVSECLIRGNIDGDFAKYVTIEKCLLDGAVMDFDGNALFTNNILSYYDCSGYTYTPVTSNVSNSLFKNNIFLNRCNNPGATYSTYYNNIFCFSTPFSNTNAVDTTNLFLGQPDSVKFVSYTQTPVRQLKLTDDFHLQATSPGINAGDDNHNIGIYGTAIPTKEGWVPMTPHIQLFNADPNTSNGKLPVKVKVKGQSSY